MKESIRPAVVSLLAFTVLLGVVYPLVMNGVAAVAFPHQATGSLIHDKEGHVVGSELIGQPFDNPAYFWSRLDRRGELRRDRARPAPTRAPRASSTTRATSARTRRSSRVRGTGSRAARGGPRQHCAPVPVDLVTASSSGLDPTYLAGRGVLPGRASRSAARPVRGRCQEPRRGVHRGQDARHLGRAACECPALESGPRRRSSGSRNRMDDDRDDRPDPDALLASVKAEESRATRARLKIFFGAAPGVGKTYAMLQEARRAHADGEDVVIGVVETHGRTRDPGAGRRPARHPAAARSTTAAFSSTELDLDAAARAPARADPGRRARPHQRAGQQACQALAGRARVARRRNRRPHHCQRAARREPRRRDPADHRASACARPSPTRCSSAPTRSS